MFVDPLPSLFLNTRTVRQHPNLRYAPLKLFFLSILWRSSVATGSFFRHVSLGPHEETIRQMLLDEDPGSTTAYPPVIFALHFDGQPLPDFMVEPTPTRFEGRRCYRFVLAGFVILIFVSRHTAPEKFLKHVLSPDRPIETYDNELANFGFLREVWNRGAQTTKDVAI